MHTRSRRDYSGAGSLPTAVKCMFLAAVPASTVTPPPTTTLQAVWPVIEAPWLGNGGHGASLRQHSSAPIFQLAVGAHRRPVAHLLFFIHTHRCGATRLSLSTSQGFLHSVLYAVRCGCRRRGLRHHRIATASSQHSTAQHSTHARPAQGRADIIFHDTNRRSD
jgi:hypothetical protein